MGWQGVELLGSFLIDDFTGAVYWEGKAMATPPDVVRWSILVASTVAGDAIRVQPKARAPAAMASCFSAMVLVSWMQSPTVGVEVRNPSALLREPRSLNNVWNWFELFSALAEWPAEVMFAVPILLFTDFSREAATWPLRGVLSSV